MLDRKDCKAREVELQWEQMARVATLLHRARPQTAQLR